MAESDLLLVFIEVAVALAGFSGIIATFQLRLNTVPRRSVLAGLSYIVNASFMAAYVSALPLVLYFFDVNENTIWSVCSLHFAFTPLIFIYIFNRDTKGRRKTRSHAIMHFSIQAICVAVAVCNAMNMVGIVFEQESGPVLAGIVVGLGAAANLFSRLLLTPIRDMIRGQEAER